MRKVGKISPSLEPVLLWQVWETGGNAVITIPVSMAKILAKDEDEKTWVIVREVSPASFQITLVTPEILANLSMGDEM